LDRYAYFKIISLILYLQITHCFLVKYIEVSFTCKDKRIDYNESSYYNMLQVFGTWIFNMK